MSRILTETINGLQYQAFVQNTWLDTRRIKRADFMIEHNGLSNAGSATNQFNGVHGIMRFVNPDGSGEL